MKLPRGRALAVSGTAAGATLLLGSMGLVIGARAGSGSTAPRTTTTQAPTVVTEVQYDDSYAIVPGPAAAEPSTDPGSPGAAITAPAAASGSVRDESSSAGQPDEPSATDPRPISPPDTRRPPTTTTSPASPPTTAGGHDDGDDGAGHRIEVPEDWPVGVPLPPIPPGCVEPHLEDGGVWNCGN